MRDLWIPTLPVDVWRLIFEEIANDLALYKRRECVKLSLVSRQVKEWTEPILYRSLVFDSAIRTENLLWTLANATTKPTDFFATRVKFVVVTYSCPLNAESISLVLRQCSGVTNLSLWRDDDGLKYQDSSILPTRNLVFLHMRVHSPLFPNIDRLVQLTRLKLLFKYPGAVLNWQHWKRLAQLERLTHFAISTVSSGRERRPITGLVQICLNHAPDSCIAIVVEPPHGCQYDNEQLFPVINNADRVVVLLSGETTERNESRRIDYPFPDRCRRLVRFFRSNLVADADGSRRFKGERDYWNVMEEVIYRATQGICEQSWEV